MITKFQEPSGSLKLLFEPYTVPSDTTSKFSSGQTRQQVKRKIEVTTDAGRATEKLRKEEADRHAQRAVQQRDQIRRNQQNKVSQRTSEHYTTNNGTIQDANKVALDKALNWYGLSNGLGQTTNVADNGRNTPSFGKFSGIQTTLPWMISGIAGTTATAFSSLPTTIGSLAGGYFGDKTVDYGTKFATGKTWAENIRERLNISKPMAEITNPGMWYGGWVGNNFGQLGRYTLNYLNPRAYGNYFSRLKDVYTKPFYTKPPTFFNGKKPVWYTGASDDEVRFQNGAIWAGIPEDEIPRTLIKQNADGETYRFTREALENGFYGKNGVDMVGEEGLASQNVINKALKKQANGEIFQDADYFTTVGGEHSDYKVLKDFPQGVLWELNDRQKLNPQWMFSDKLKKSLHLEEGTISYNLVDWLGGQNLSRLLGYKPFTYRQGIGVTKDGSNRVFYFDPTHWEKTGTIIPE